MISAAIGHAVHDHMTCVCVCLCVCVCVRVCVRAYVCVLLASSGAKKG